MNNLVPSPFCTHATPSPHAVAHSYAPDLVGFPCGKVLDLLEKKFTIWNIMVPYPPQETETT